MGLEYFLARKQSFLSMVMKEPVLMVKLSTFSTIPTNMVMVK